jgi:hypothetical protein
MLALEERAKALPHWRFFFFHSPAPLPVDLWLSGRISRFDAECLLPMALAGISLQLLDAPLYLRTTVADASTAVPSAAVPSVAVPSVMVAAAGGEGAEDFTVVAIGRGAYALMTDRGLVRCPADEAWSISAEG